MKKTLFALVSLTFASLSFAGGDSAKAPAKCDDKDSKCCCCCKCCCCSDSKDANACKIEKADGAKDAKPAEAPVAK